MEVFECQGQEGVLTICIDGDTPVQLNFKQKVQVSVRYNGNVNDNNPGELKTEASPLVEDEQKKSDPVNEELNIYIERAKNNGHRNDDLFSTAAEDLFGQSARSSRNVDEEAAEAKKICVRNGDGAEQGGRRNGDNSMDVDCESFVDDDECGESVCMDVKDKGNDGVDDTSTKDDIEEKEAFLCQGGDKDGGVSLRQTKKSDMDSCANSSGICHSEDKNASISKGKSSASDKDDLIAKLVKEVAEKKKSIKRMTLSTTSLTAGNSSRPNTAAKTAVYKCNLCGKKFTDSYLLSVHHRADNTKVMCKLCDLECMSKANLIIHEHLMHSKNGRKAGKVCPVCAQPFEKHTDILSHIRSQHTKEGLYKCCVCRILYQSYQTFKSHIDLHYKERIRRDAKNNLQRGSQKRDQDNSLTARQSSTVMMDKMQGENVDSGSSASKRKSQKPVHHHRSLINYQPPAKPVLPAKATIPTTPQIARQSTPVQSSNTSSQKKSIIKSLSLKTGLKAQSLKTSKGASGDKPVVPKLVVKLPVSSSLSSRSKTSFSPIKKQVLASRLKPLLTPSLLASRKRQLNQLPSSTGKTLPKAGPGRGPLKTLPRVTSQSKAVIAKKALLTTRGRKSFIDKLWKCHFCERVFKTKGEYINHKKPSRIIQMCKVCGFTSTSKALYIIHNYQKHTNRDCDRYTVANKDLRCHLCEEPIVLNEVLNHVMSKHTGEHPYECCVCKKPAQAYEDWVKHGKSHVRSQEEKDCLGSQLLLNLTVKTEEAQERNEIFCTLCKVYHPNEKEFVRHHKSETHKKECELCQLVCYTEAGYIIHRCLAHGLSTGENGEALLVSSSENLKPWHEDDVANDSNLDSTKCPSCLECFPMKDLLSHVMTVHTQESPYKCCTCKATLSTLDDYMDHCNFHLGRKLYSQGTQRCLACGLRFESRIRLSRHKLMHKPSCPYCLVEFSSKALLDVHLKNLHTKDMTPCSFCGKLFAESNRLAEHERNHFFFKKSPCPICGLSVTNVNKHLARVHPKPDTQYLCNLCGKKFALKCDLSRHMGKHSSDRKYECDICQKTFKRASGLRRHAQSHLQDRKYHECHICGKKCSQRNNLSVHMRVHSATKAFTCEHCGQGFNYNQSLQTHIRKKHTEDLPAAIPPESTMAVSLPEPSVLNVRRVKPLEAPVDVVSEPMHQGINSSVVVSTPPSIAVPAPLSNYSEHPMSGGPGGYHPADPSQHYYPDPTGYMPVNAVAFHRSYNDLINTIVRSEHDNTNNNNNNNSNSSNTNNNNDPQQSAPHHGYPIYYPQF